MPKVSVIIPFNNVEGYISQCLDSVLSQTLSDIEVILINDASLDGSREIAQKYADKDSRIKIIDVNERNGQGYARNRGIEIAQGEYIGFVDSDDFVEQNIFEELYNSAKQADTDITMCQVREYDDINDKYITSNYYSLDILAQFGNRIFSAEDTKNEILEINVALWNKIYKREYLLNIGEKFPEGYIYEDLPFFFGSYLPAKRINIVWKVLYNYRVNRKNSTMRQFNNKILDRLPMVSLTYEKLKSFSFLNDMHQKIQGWIINDLFHRYILLKESYHKEFFFMMKKIFQNLEIEDTEDWYWKTVYHFEGYLLVMNNSFEDFCLKVFSKYLDIHEIENRLRSEITNHFDIYEKLAQNNKQCEDISTVQHSMNGEIMSLKNQTQEIIKALENVKNKISSLNTEQHEIPQTSITTYISEDITRKMNEEHKSLYSDIKDLSYVLYDNYTELNKRLDFIENSLKQNYEARISALEKGITKQEK